MNQVFTTVESEGDTLFAGQADYRAVVSDDHTEDVDIMFLASPDLLEGPATSIVETGRERRGRRHHRGRPYE